MMDLSLSQNAPDGRFPAGAAERVAMDFLLDQLVTCIDTHDGDLLAALVLAALNSGNCAHLPIDQLGAFEIPSPVQQRRPRTVRQVAETLGQPYETVRRRFVVLETAGHVVRRGRNGFVVPETAERSAERLEAARRTHGKIQRMVNALSALQQR